MAVEVDILMVVAAAAAADNNNELVGDDVQWGFELDDGENWL